MSLQNQLNNECINKLPKIKATIDKADNFTRNQMVDLTIRSCLNSKTSIDNMSEMLLGRFQEYVLNTFNYNNLI